MVLTRMISPPRQAATIFSRHLESGPTNFFFVEPVCRTQNSRVIRQFPANDVAVTFMAKRNQPLERQVLNWHSWLRLRASMLRCWRAPSGFLRNAIKTLGLEGNPSGPFNGQESLTIAFWHEIR